MYCGTQTKSMAGKFPEPPSLPGASLRALRRARALSIEELAARSEVNYRTIQKIETGQTQQPAREILIALLRELSDVRKLNSTERKRVLEPFGYRDQSPLPETHEIEQIREQWERAVFELPHPAILVDFAHRIHSWNRYAPRLIGLPYGHPALNGLREKTLIDMLFDPQNAAAFGMENADDFLTEMLEVFRAEFEPFRQEAWCHEFLQMSSARYPLFREMWERLQSQPVRELSLRTIGPIELQPAGAGRLRFYLLGTDFLGDSRFRVIQYLPADATTLRQCLHWIEAEEAGATSS
jgi:transcriptional regulator with XRE-family HTH domain